MHSERRWIGAVLLVQVGVAAWVARRSFFFYDDYLFLQIARTSHVTWDYLSQSAFGHFIPSFHLFNKVIARGDPISYPLAGTLLVGFHLCCGIAMWRVLRALVRPGPLVVAGVAVTGFSLISLVSVPWWSAGLCLLPSTALNLATIAAVLWWDRNRRWPALAMTAAFYLAAMTFWEKSLLVAAYAALLLVLVVDGNLPLRRRGRAILERWPLWAVLAAVGGGYLALYLRGPYSEEAAYGDVTATTMAQHLGLSAFEGLFPGMAGIRYPFVPILGQVWLGWAVPAVVALALVVWTSVKAARARHAWTFFVLGYLLNQTVLGYGRIGYSGIHTGREYRYQLDDLLLFVIAAVVATQAAWDARPADSRPRLSRRAWALALAALVVVALPTWTASVDRMLADLPGPGARAYVDRFNESYEALRAAGNDRPILSSTMPPSMITPVFYPYNRGDHLLPLLRSDLEFATNTSDGLYVDVDGEVKPGRFTPMTEHVFDEPVCVAAGDDEVTVHAPVAELGSANWFVRVGFGGPVDGSAVVQVDTPDSTFDLRGTGEPWEVDGDELVISGLTVPITGVGVRLAADPGSCITSIAVGGVS